MEAFVISDLTVVHFYAAQTVFCARCIWMNVSARMRRE